jgi:hypothetical protein
MALSARSDVLKALFLKNSSCEDQSVDVVKSFVEYLYFCRFEKLHTHVKELSVLP